MNVLICVCTNAGTDVCMHVFLQSLIYTRFLPSPSLLVTYYSYKTFSITTRPPPSLFRALHFASFHFTLLRSLHFTLLHFAALHGR